MLQFRQYLCGLIGKPVTTSFRGLSDRVNRGDILPKGKIGKTSFISDFFWGVLGCNDFEPVPNNACVLDSDCFPGQQCKEGACFENPANCINTGCSDHHECNESTGNCDFVPECSADAECNQIDGGEQCIANICKQPTICLEGMPGMCAPTWTCVDRKCVKL
jgi:hypothetical protein